MEGKNLSGQLVDWSISDLLQIMHVTKKTGSLEIAGDRTGRIHFQEGSIIGADLTGSRQNYVAADKDDVADVLYVLSSLETGEFAFEPGSSVDADQTWEVEEVLGAVENLRDLEKEVAESGLIDATAIRLSESLDEPKTVSPEDWKVLVGLIQPFNFSHLEARNGRGGAVRVLHTLSKLEVAEAVVDDETDWLDEVAVGITPSEKVAEAKHIDSSDSDSDTDDEDEVEIEPEAATDDEEILESVERTDRPEAKGIAASASTTLTDGVYDEIRRLRSRVSDK